MGHGAGVVADAGRDTGGLDVRVVGGSRLRPSLRRWWQRNARLLGAAGLLGALYALGAMLPFWFLESPAAGVAFFPPAGLTLAALLLSPARRWPLWLGVVATAELLVDLGHGQTLPMALGFVAANVAEPVVGATATRAAGRHGTPSLRHGLLVYLAFAVIVGPLVGGIVGATVSSLAGEGTAWASIAGRWWLGDALGVLVVATPILAWSRRPPFEPQATPAETALITVVAVGVTLAPPLLWGRPLVFTVLPVLVWAALRGGARTMSTAGVGVALAADWAAVTGRADELLAPASPDDLLVDVQLFLAVTLLAGLMLAVEVVERRRTEHELLRAVEERNRAERAVSAAAAREQRRIAAEIHDIVGHALNVVLLQAGAARRSVTHDTAVAHELMESIEATGREAFRDLDAALGLIDRSPDRRPGPGLTSVPELVSTMRQAGLRVQLHVEGERPAVSTIVDWSAYRIVQEALTNVAKHAPTARARVEVRYEPGRVHLAVIDDGAGATGERRRGHGRGLIGVRERVAVLGGELAVGPAPEGGYALRTALPWRGPRA